LTGDLPVIGDIAFRQCNTVCGSIGHPVDIVTVSTAHSGGIAFPKAAVVMAIGTGMQYFVGEGVQTLFDACPRQRGADLYRVFIVFIFTGIATAKSLGGAGIPQHMGVGMFAYGNIQSSRLVLYINQKKIHLVRAERKLGKGVIRNEDAVGGQFCLC